MSIPTTQEEIDRLTMIGFRPLTYPYQLPMEEEEFENAKAQLGVEPFALVWHTEDEVEIWTVHEDTEPS